MSICNRNCCENKINSSYIKWLIEVLGPVILGSKPAEILNLSSKDMNKESKLNEIKSFFSNCTKLSYKIINIPDGGIRLVFINKDALSITLNNKKCLNFLKFIGYPSNYNLDEYLNILIDKLNSDNFPHEIGIFLGYPLTVSYTHLDNHCRLTFIINSIDFFYFYVNNILIVIFIYIQYFI